MTIQFFLCAAITALSAFISLGFSMKSVSDTTGRARAQSLYTCARSLALAITSVIPFLTGSTQWLQAIAVGMIIVQVLDAVVGLTIKDKMKTFGPAGVAIANLAALTWLIIHRS